MRSFQQILHELKDVVAQHRAGENLSPPPSLSTLNILGRRVAFAAAGLENPVERPPVLLLHGFGGFFMDWPRIMAPLSRHTRVYALDLPGWGFSEENPEISSLEGEVKVIDEFLRLNGLSRVIICGISYGAGIAWAAASMGLPRLRQAILLNPMPPHPMRFLRSPIYRGIFLLNKSDLSGSLALRFLNKTQYKIICRENLLNDRLLDTFYLDLAYLVIKQPKMQSILGKHARGANDVDWSDWEHRLAGTRIPVSIFQGRQDRIFSMESAQFLHRLIPTSQLIEVDRCGHAMVFDQHRKVSDFIVKILRQRGSHERAQENSG